MAWVERHASRTLLESRPDLGDRARRLYLPDVVLDVALEVQPPDDQSGDDGEDDHHRDARREAIEHEAGVQFGIADEDGQVEGAVQRRQNAEQDAEAPPIRPIEVENENVRAIAGASWVRATRYIAELTRDLPTF
jgi:hypothetical protein